ncbi:hypothetical protein SLEP1_g38542 [Rubroshorea leprosula]|nr:hypothetical protein SLEP1_g38542 [Rubroshorea leprosula]
MMEIKIKMKQTVATAHVGVTSIDLSSSSPPISPPSVSLKFCSFVGMWNIEIL